MGRYKIYPEQTSYYYSTCTIIAWLPIFQEEKYFQSIIDSLKYLWFPKSALGTNMPVKLSFT